MILDRRYLVSSILLFIVLYTAGCADFSTPEESAECIAGQKECPTGQVCVDYTCFSICETNAQCEEGMACIEQTCRSTIATCDNHNDCSPSEFCNNEICVDKYPLYSKCTEDYECLTENCLEGQCQIIGCGNGTVEDNEECDDGNNSNFDSCTNYCLTARCGDGFIYPESEQCDDGFENNSDVLPNACRENCQLASCGDAVVDANEVCDEGTSNSDSYTLSTAACNSTCTGYPEFCGDGVVNGQEECDSGESNSDTTANACSLTCRLPFCGNNTIDDGEECDLGTATNELGVLCNSECLIPRCGNGFMENDEECDDGNSNNTDSCTNLCKTARCGDGFVWNDVEECDDNNSSNLDACLNWCQRARCGDGFTWENQEECDDGDLSNTNECLNSCAHARCGDGFVHDGVESCDDANASNTDNCLTTCASPSCGDGYVWLNHEECDDGADLNGTEPSYCSAECASQIYTGNLNLDYQSIEENTFGAYRKIAGDVFIQSLDASDEAINFFRITMENIKEITGNLIVKNTNELYEVSFPNLIAIGGSLNIVPHLYFPNPLAAPEESPNNHLGIANFPQLKTVGTNIEISSNPHLTKVNFRELHNAPSVNIIDNPWLCFGLFIGMNFFPAHEPPTVVLPNRTVVSGEECDD